MTAKENKLELRAIPELYNKNFFIPDYQRGYRWGTRQVEQLIEDLTGFFEKGRGEFYCLQPVVVKALSDKEAESYGLDSEDDGNRWYEVIDGQQRLTTIRIILALFGRIKRRFKSGFTIHYKTRPELGKIFDSFIYDDEEDQYSVSVDSNLYKDIDSWHIVQAANCLLDCLISHPSSASRASNSLPGLYARNQYLYTGWNLLRQNIDLLHHHK